MGDSGDDVSDTTILSEISTTEESETGISLSVNHYFSSGYEEHAKKTFLLKVISLFFYWKASTI